MYVSLWILIPLCLLAFVGLLLGGFLMLGFFRTYVRSGEFRDDFAGWRRRF